ncbi:glycosyl hydrolase family 28-related protein [Paenibacillus sp. MBLB4367]|uniref:glycosyl hydrolase family 28-related protein n=1 Tax=Paenibacillus sp. MBLB4367 TaxID=3384767 RepID=UPI00390833AD
MEDSVKRDRGDWTEDESGGQTPERNEDGRDTGGFISRRKLLASIGMAGAAFAAGNLLPNRMGETVALAVYGGGSAEMLAGAGNLECATIPGLRSMASAPAAGTIYFVTDSGQEGFFAYDAADTTSPDNTGTIVVSTPAGTGYRFKRIIETEYLSVKWFGAKGDGSTDDTQRIRDAINAVSAMGGGTVFFPRGTYIVAPSLSSRIDLKSNVNLLGEGTNSVIKVKNNAGDYWTIFGTMNPASARVENVRIAHLCIDQNVDNNTSCGIDPAKDAAGNYYWRQFCIALYDYENIVIDHVRFDPTCGVNTITLNKPTCQKATITDCEFRFVHAKGTSTANYDNSAVYLNGTNHTVMNCKFYAAIDAKALGAIETHTGQSVITGNVTDGYCTGVNLQASEQTTALDHCDMTIAGNTFSNANNGIQLWPRLGYPLKNVTISGNTISLNNTAHLRITTTGIGTAGGAEDVGAFENITISGNTILFKEELTYRSSLDGAFTCGIGFTRGADTSVNPLGIEYRNILISNNLIRNAPTFGIHIGCPNPAPKTSTFSNLEITGNVIVNAGHFPSPAVTEQYNTGIYLRKTAMNAKISNNCIIDTYDSCKMLYSIRINDNDGTYTNVEASGNFIQAKQGGPWLDLGGSVTVSDTNKRIKFASEHPPASGTFDPGDIVLSIKTSIMDGQTPSGYKCASGGTIGSLSGVTATGSSGSNKITVSSSSQLKVGQWIDIVQSDSTTVSRKILRIGGNELRLDRSLTAAASSGNVSFTVPVLKTFGAVGKLPGIVKTTTLTTVTALEAEVNKLKDALRDYGIIASS